MNVQYCRSCRAPVIWVVSERGKSMPVDVEPVPDGNLVLETTGGKLTARVHAPDLFAGPPRAPLHKSHFATCPDADGWRRAPKREEKPEP